jgi:hypothetical protein
VLIDLAQVVPGAEQALRLNRPTRDRYLADSSGGEEGGREVVPASIERCLPRTPRVVDDQRVDVDQPRFGARSSTGLGRQSVLDEIAPVPQRVKYLRLEGCVDVDVDVPVCARLTPLPAHRRPSRG